MHILLHVIKTMESGIGTLSTNCNSALHRAVREANKNELVKKTSSIVKSSEQAIKALDKECAALKLHQKELEQQMHLCHDNSSHSTVNHPHSAINQTYKTTSKSFNAGVEHGRARKQSTSSISSLVREGSHTASPSGPAKNIAHRTTDIAKYKQRRASHDVTLSKFRENKDRTGRDEETPSTSDKRVSFAKINADTSKHGGHQGEVHAGRRGSYIKHDVSSSAGTLRRISNTSAVSGTSTPPYSHASNSHMQRKNSNVASTSGQTMSEMQAAASQRGSHASADIQGSAFNLSHRKILHDQQARLSKDSLFYHLSEQSTSDNTQPSAMNLLKRGSISSMADTSISRTGPGYLHGTAARHEQSPQTHEDAQETQRILNYAITCIKKADTERMSATEMEERAEKEAIAKASQNASHTSAHSRNISNPSTSSMGGVKAPSDGNMDNKPAFLQQLEKFIKEGASHDIKISSKLMSQIEPLLPKQQKLNNENSKSVKYYIEVINTLQNMRKLGSTTFDPEEILNCRYLRLSKANIEELEEMCRLRGIDPGIHPHSDITGYNTNLFDDVHEQDDRDHVIAVAEARKSEGELADKSRE